MQRSLRKTNYLRRDAHNATRPVVDTRRMVHTGIWIAHLEFQHLRFAHIYERLLQIEIAVAIAIPNTSEQ